MKKISRFLVVNNYYLLVLFFILLVGFFFRFYNIPLRYGFDYDATRDALIALQGAQAFQFPFTGADSSVGPFHFGPWYYYFIILFRMFIPWDYAPWLYISILSFLTIPIMYKIGEEVGNKNLGLILAGLFAIAPSQIGPAVGLSNPHVIPFYAALSILLFIRLVKHSLSGWWALAFGVSLGLGINHHYQMVLLLFLPVFLFFLKKEKRILYFFACTSGIILTFLPMLIFDFFHGWPTVTGVFYYIFHMRNIRYVPNNWTLYIGSFWLPFWSYTIGVASYLGGLFLVLSMGASAFLLQKKKLHKEYIGVFVTFLICFILLRYYSGERVYYQVLFLQPFIIIISGVFIWALIETKNYIKILGFLLLGVIVYYAIPDDIQRLRPIESHVVFAKEVEVLIKQFPNNTFTLYECGVQERNRLQAIALLLHDMGKFSDSGTKIGLVTTDCVQSEIVTGRIQGLAAVRLSQEMVKNTSTWTLVSPKTVYNKNALWWQK